MTIPTLVLGASLRPERYSYQAIMALQQAGHPVCAIGQTSGRVGQVTIGQEWPLPGQIHTLSLYINPQRQIACLTSILQLAPQRVIFNPGTEHPLLASALTHEGIYWEHACTLVLLATGQFGSLPQ